MSDAEARRSPEVCHRCGPAARWLPRILAGSILVAALLVSQRLEALGGVPGMVRFSLVPPVGAALIALWVVHRGGEVRLVVERTAEGLIFHLGRLRRTLPLDRIQGLRYEPPFGPSRHWLPATVLLSAEGESWRLPALLEDGGRLIDEIVEATGRRDLCAWALELRLSAKMRRIGPRLVLGYAVAAAFLFSGVLFYLRGSPG